MGRVARIGVKGERSDERGLPKPSVTTARVTFGGLEGDFNRHRHEHRRDEGDSAVLLLPLETVEELQSEGWPVQPGDLGENLTTQGVGYAEVGAGAEIHVGSVRLAVTRACDPCTNLYLLPYVGRSRGPEFLKAMLGRRGWYARVVEPGEVAVGDTVRVG